jgi:hypothetical protein
MPRVKNLEATTGGEKTRDKPETMSGYDFFMNGQKRLKGDDVVR